MGIWLGLGLGSAALGKGGIAPPAELVPVNAFATSHDGQVITGLDIWCDGTPLEINHKVTLRWCRIWHRSGEGIKLGSGASGSVMSDFIVTHVAPPAGAEPFPDIVSGPGQVNIYGYQASDVTINRAILSHGASGIYLQNCDNVRARVIEGGPTHGPFPRGQLLQLDNSPNCSILDWSHDCPVDASWPEDNINVYQSQNTVIGRGRIVNNGAPNGAGVMFEGGSTGHTYDVDMTGAWNSAFSAFGAGTDVVYERVRTRDNYPPEENPSDRTPPSGSNGATFVAAEGATASLTGGAYFNPSNPSNVRVEYNGGSFTAYDASSVDFTPRQTITVMLPDWPAWVQPPDPDPENLWAASSVPSNAAWSKSGVTAAAGTGESGSDAVRETAITGEHQWSRTQTKAAGAINYQIRARIKPQGRTRLNLFVFDAAYSANSNGYFFFSGTPSFQAGSGSGGMGAPTGGGISDDGGGFFEIYMNVTSDDDTAMPVIFYTSAADYQQSHPGNPELGFDVDNLRLFEV